MASAVRTLSFFSKWLAELVREPTLLLSLVLGPFLILLLFGVGTRIGGAPKPRTIVVTAGASEADLLKPTAADLSQYLQVVGTTADRGGALAALARGEVDLVAELPDDPQGFLARGEQAPIRIHVNEIDPLKDSYARAYLASQLGALNQAVIREAIVAAQAPLQAVPDFVANARQHLRTAVAARDDAIKIRGELAQVRQRLEPLVDGVLRLVAFVDTVDLPFRPVMRDQLAALRAAADELAALRQTIDQLDARLAQATGVLPTTEDLTLLDERLTRIERAASQFRAIPSDVLSAPFTLSLTNLAPFELSTIAFYTPAVLVLLMQHLAVTLGALSLSRIRLLGLRELFQALPVRPSEVVIGNYLAYGTLCLLVGGGLVLLLVGLLGVPVIGSPLLLLAILLLLLGSALGTGFVISLLARSEQQAAQLAMLVLIASVFFSGFMIYLEAIDWPYRVVSYLLPATYAIRSLRNVMLHGTLYVPGDLLALMVAAVALFALTILLFRREFRPR